MKFQTRLLTALFAGALAASAAAINFQPGNPAPGSNEVLVHLTSGEALLLGGFANLTAVQFQSDNTADLIQAHPGNGVSFITGAGGADVLAPITLSLPFGLTFTDISFNLQCGQDCAPVKKGTASLLFAATFADGTTAAETRAFGNGSNRWTAYAVGSAFTSVTFGATIPYSQAEQIKLSGIAVPTAPTPEPATLGVVGAGLIAAVYGSRKRLQR